LAEGEAQIKRLFATRTPLLQALDEGRKVTRKRYEELIKQIEQRRKRAEEKRRAAAGKRDERIQKKLKEIQEQLQEMDELAEGAEDTLEDRLLQIDRELERLDKYFMFVMAQIQYVNQQLQIIGQQLLLRKAIPRGQSPDEKQQAFDPVLAYLLAQQLALQQECAYLWQLAQRIAETADRLLILRARLQQSYEQTLGKVRKEKDELKKWSERLQRARKRVGRKAKPNRPSRKARAQEKIIVHSIALLLEFKPEIERERVLDALARRAKRKVTER